jgi:hypothetical protein
MHLLSDGLAWVLALAVHGELIDGILDDLHELATAPSISKLPPNVEFKRYWSMFRRVMRPRVLRVRAVFREEGSQSFQRVSQRQHRSGPVLEIFEPTECERVGNLLTFGLPDATQESHVLHEPRVTSRWRVSRPPEISFSKLLGDHLEVVKLMAGSCAVSPKQDQHSMV